MTTPKTTPASRASLSRPGDSGKTLEKIYKYYDASEQPFRLIEYAVKTQWEALDRLQFLGIGRKQFLAAALDQPAAMSAARALLDIAQAELARNRTVPDLRAWVELVAVLEALADVLAALFAATGGALNTVAESLKTRIRKEQAAGLQALKERASKAGWSENEALRRKAGFEKGLNQRQTRIVAAVRAYSESVVRSGASAKTFQQFFRTFAEVASEGLAPLVSREVRAPMERQAELLRRGGIEDVDLSVGLKNTVIRRYCGLPENDPPAAPTSMNASDKYEAKVLKEVVELVRKRKAAGGLSRLTLDLALSSRACQDRIRLLRGWAKAVQAQKKAEQRLKQVEEQCKGNTLKAMCTLGLGADREAKKLRTEARDALMTAKKRSDKIREAVESSGDALRAFVRSVGDVAARLIPDVARAAKSSFGNGDKEAGEAVSAAVSLRLRDSASSPAQVGFWSVVLRALAAQALRIRVRETVDEFNTRARTRWAGFFPEMEVVFFDDEDTRRVHLATCCVGESVFHRSVEEFAEDFESVLRGAYNSMKERTHSEKGLNWLRAGELAARSSDDPQRALAEILLGAGQRLKALDLLHQKELSRIQVSDINSIQDQFIKGMEEVTDKDDEPYLKRVREVIMFTKPVANALLYADTDSGLVQASGKEIFLALERVMLERAGHVKDVLAELTHLYETSRQELLNLPPSELKRLLKDVPNLSRAMNFLSKAQKIKKDTEGFGMSCVQDWTMGRNRKTIRTRLN